MGMPQDLVLVRHGESEGNVASKQSREGDNSAFTDEFRARHPSMWRLTDRGRGQLKQAGAWIKKNIGRTFDRYYTSSHIRAMESAAHLKLAQAQWFATFLLREREWGELAGIPIDERESRYAEDMKRKMQSPFYWQPTGGESIAQVCFRVDRLMQTLHRECDGKRVIVVCHGEVMWAIRVLIERMTQMRFRELDESSAPWDRINNGQIIHYTRHNPETQHIDTYIKWRRSICPWDQKRASGNWEPVIRRRFSNQQLLEYLQSIPQLVK